MQKALVWITLCAALAAPFSARAQSTDTPSEPLLRAALVVTMYDSFAAKCSQSGDFSAADRATVQAWQNANGVEGIRARLREFSATQKQQIEKAVADNIQTIAARGMTACAAAVSLSKLPDAQFAKVSPQLLAQANNSNTTAPAKSSGDVPRENSTGGATAAASAQQSETVKQIEGFGFDTVMRMGVGGFLAPTTVPIVFLRGGDLLQDVEGLAYGGGLQAHKRAKPGAWTRWRREGSELQVLRKEGWKALYFQTMVSRLPDNFKLNGLFRALSGAGTLAVGGTQSVAAWRDYRFAPDGTVMRGGGAGSTGQTGDTSVVTKSAAANQRGRYMIEDGLVLRINYEDGSSERRILITDDPKKPITAIWLDGTGYVKRDR